jgi:hypothetical protein
MRASAYTRERARDPRSDSTSSFFVVFAGLTLDPIREFGEVGIQPAGRAPQAWVHDVCHASVVLADDPRVRRLVVLQRETSAQFELGSVGGGR